MILKNMKSIENNFDNLEVNELLIKHFNELKSVSPEGSTHVLDIDGLKNQSIKFWSLWEDAKLVGCGALKFLSETHGEFKSIRVADNFKKKGYGKKIIVDLLSFDMLPTSGDDKYSNLFEFDLKFINLNFDY